MLGDVGQPTAPIYPALTLVRSSKAEANNAARVGMGSHRRGTLRQFPKSPRYNDDNGNLNGTAAAATRTLLRI